MCLETSQRPCLGEHWPSSEKGEPGSAWQYPLSVWERHWRLRPKGIATLFQVVFWNSWLNRQRRQEIPTGMHMPLDRAEVSSWGWEHSQGKSPKWPSKLRWPQRLGGLSTDLVGRGYHNVLCTPEYYTPKGPGSRWYQATSSEMEKEWDSPFSVTSAGLLICRPGKNCHFWNTDHPVEVSYGLCDCRICSGLFSTFIPGSNEVL